MDPRRADLEIETLCEISKVLSLSTDINKAFTSALNLLGPYLGMENGTLSLFDPVTGEGVVGRIFSIGMPVVIEDIGQEPLFLNRTASWRDLEREPRAFVGVPVTDGRAVLGVLTVDRSHRTGPHDFGRDVRFLTVISRLVAARIRLLQLESPRRGEVAAGIEPVVEQARQPIEAAALGWFAGHAARVASVELVEVNAAVA